MCIELKIAHLSSSFLLVIKETKIGLVFELHHSKNR